jgi:hypothetical protein
MRDAGKQVKRRDGEDTRNRPRVTTLIESARNQKQDLRAALLRIQQAILRVEQYVLAQAAKRAVRAVGAARTSPDELLMQAATRVQRYVAKHGVPATLRGTQDLVQMLISNMRWALVDELRHWKRIDGGEGRQLSVVAVDPPTDADPARIARANETATRVLGVLLAALRKLKQDAPENWTALILTLDVRSILRERGNATDSEIETMSIHEVNQAIQLSDEDVRSQVDAALTSISLAFRKAGLQIPHDP